MLSLGQLSRHVLECSSDLEGSPESASVWGRVSNDPYRWRMEIASVQRAPAMRVPNGIYVAGVQRSLAMREGPEWDPYRWRMEIASVQRAPAMRRSRMGSMLLAH